MIQLHHLHGRAVPTPYLRGQSLSEHGHLFAIRGANMGREVSLGNAFTTVRTKQKQIGQLACRQPGEAPTVIHPPECQAPVPSEAMPTQLGGLESFAAHGFDGIPEDRLHMSAHHEHTRAELCQTLLHTRIAAKSIH
jgi:hypothetical protein